MYDGVWGFLRENSVLRTIMIEQLLKKPVGSRPPSHFLTEYFLPVLSRNFIFTG
jgi:hypothetical protein